jgi:hypothetical protein
VRRADEVDGRQQGAARGIDRMGEHAQPSATPHR